MAGNEASVEQPVPERQLAQFLEDDPPGTVVNCPDLIVVVGAYQSEVLASPDLQLHCTSEECNGPRFFEATKKFGQVRKHVDEGFVVYTCRNCRKTTRHYALLVSTDENAKSGLICKVGEFPAFGPPVPSRAISLVGPDRELFLRGRRAENQGLGIGAFAYYRRVVEQQKDRLLGEIIRVAERTGASAEIVRRLKDAREETQFSKAVEVVKDSLPAVLLINGHNPLVLLHQACSDGLHARTDEECLEAAASVRIVLYELADRIGNALKDQHELTQAVSRLLGNRSREQSN